MRDSFAGATVSIPTDFDRFSSWPKPGGTSARCSGSSRPHHGIGRPIVEVVETPAAKSGSIALARDCKATRIPSGSTVTLPGTRVTVTQSLGGHFTVTTDDGALPVLAR